MASKRAPPTHSGSLQQPARDQPVDKGGPLLPRCRPDRHAVRDLCALQGEVVTIDGREYLVEVRAVRINEATDQFEGFKLLVRPLG